MKLLPLLILPIIAYTQSSSDLVLDKIFSDYHEYVYRNFPEAATYEGDHRYNNRLTDLSAAAHKARYDSLRVFKSGILKIKRSSVSEENKLNYTLFLRILDQSLEGEKFNFHLQPLNQMGGIHIDFPQMVEVQPFNNYKDFKNYLERLNKFPAQLKDVINNMREGIKYEIIPPRQTIEPVLNQISEIIDVPVDSSVFMVFPKPGILKPEEENEIVNEMRASVKNVMIEYRMLQIFIEKEYLVATRDTVGVWAYPEGEERYRYAVKTYTSVDNITPQQVFETGLKEVERIKAEMEKIKSDIGFKGTLREFNNHLRSSPEFYFTSKDSLMKAYRKILSRMDEQLPQLFAVLPRTPYDLKELEEYRAKNAPAAYYYSAPEDGSRPGYFYVNTYDLPSRPSYTMTALALHEAVPGHHTQIAIAKEQKNLPWFRRESGVTAFIEGWALYAESLGYETGMYDDIYQKYGALSFEMWRACRLVVDAGMHHLRWPREKAVEFMKENLALSELDINSEVDRYIAWPGQALAYKIGELKIKELRKKAERELGDKFDLRLFHSMLLEEGALPLEVLEERVNGWIRERKLN